MHEESLNCSTRQLSDVNFCQDEHSERRLAIEDIHVPLNNEPASQGSNLEHIDDLNSNAMLVLLALCRRLTKEESMTTGDVEQLYAVVCEEYEQKMKSHTTVWKYLKDFEERQIITSRVATVTGGRGRTTHLSMPHYLPKDQQVGLKCCLERNFEGSFQLQSNGDAKIEDDSRKVVLEVILWLLDNKENLSL